MCDKQRRLKDKFLMCDKQRRLKINQKETAPDV